MIKDRRTQKEEINLNYEGHFLISGWYQYIRPMLLLNQLQVSPLQPCKLLESENDPTFEGKTMGLLYVKIYTSLDCDCVPQ